MVPTNTFAAPITVVVSMFDAAKIGTFFCTYKNLYQYNGSFKLGTNRLLFVGFLRNIIHTI